MAVAAGFGKAIRARPILQDDQGSERVPLAGRAVDRRQRSGRSVGLLWVSCTYPWLRGSPSTAIEVVAVWLNSGIRGQLEIHQP